MENTQECEAGVATGADERASGNLFQIYKSDGEITVTFLPSNRKYTFAPKESLIIRERFTGIDILSPIGQTVTYRAFDLPDGALVNFLGHGGEEDDFTREYTIADLGFESGVTAVDSAGVESNPVFVDGFKNLFLFVQFSGNTDPGHFKTFLKQISPSGVELATGIWHDEGYNGLLPAGADGVLFMNLLDGDYTKSKRQSSWGFGDLLEGADGFGIVGMGKTMKLHFQWHSVPGDDVVIDNAYFVVKK